MKTYEQLIQEVYDHGATVKNKKFGVGRYLNKPITKGHEHIGTVKGHKIYRGKHDEGMDRYSAVSPEGHVTNVLTVHTKKHSIKVSGSATTGKGIKQHDMYHHLITKHDKVITTDEQTEGGHRIWKQLAKKHSVNIHGWDPKAKKAVNIDHRLRDKDETHHDVTNDRGHAHITNMHLVAHKK